MSLKKTIHFSDIDYSFLDIEFPNLDILHNRIGAGLYHCISIS